MAWREKKRWKTDFSDKYKPEKPFKPNVSVPKISKSLLISIILLIAICVLSYFTFTSGSYVNILEEEKNTLQSQLDTCNNQTQTLTSDLSVCNEDLSTKTTALSDCETEKTTLTGSFSTCKDDLDTCEKDLDVKTSLYDTCKKDYGDFEDLLDKYNRDDADDLENYIEGLKDDRSDCQDDLSTCQSDKSTLQTNYNTLKGNYAKAYCCLLNQTDGNITHYDITTGHVIICGTTGTALTC